MRKPLTASPFAKRAKCSTPLSKVPDIPSEAKSQNQGHILEEMTALLPNVLNEMEKNGHLETWVNFSRLINIESFHFENIGFLLFMDVCRPSDLHRPGRAEVWKRNFRSSQTGRAEVRKQNFRSSHVHRLGREEVRKRNFRFSKARQSGIAEAELQIFTGHVEWKCGSGTSDLHRSGIAELRKRNFRASQAW